MSSRERRESSLDATKRGGSSEGGVAVLVGERRETRGGGGRGARRGRRERRGGEESGGWRGIGGAKAAQYGGAMDMVDLGWGGGEVWVGGVGAGCRTGALEDSSGRADGRR